MLLNVAFFLLVAIGGGLSSAWYMMERGSPLTTKRIGAWVIWPTAGHVDSDPYTRAFITRRGALPLSPTIALTFYATTDDDGRRLHSACEYEIEGESIDAVWWSLAVYDERGRLIPNPADRHSYNLNSTMRAPSGQFKIVLAREARAGNWLPVARGGAIRLMLVLQEPSGTWRSGARPLPSVRRVQCA